MRFAAVIAMVGLALGGCATGPEGPTGSTAEVVVVMPFEVEGQDQDPRFVGQAFAESLAVGLAQSDELHVLDVPAADVGDSLADATHVVRGTLTRVGEAVEATLRLSDPSDSESQWETRDRSDTGDLSELAHHLVVLTGEALGASWPDLYDYVGNITGGAAMSASPLAATVREARRSGDAEKFLDSSAELVARFPDDPVAHVLNAWALLLAWDEAPSREGLLQLKDRLAELDRVDPRSPYDELLRAYIYRASGEPNRARELYSRVLSRRDLTAAARAWALRQRSLAIQQTGNKEAALSDADEAVRLQAANPGNRIAQSRAYEAAGRLDESIASSRLALALEPHRWRHQQRVGLAYARAGRLADAVPFMERACEASAAQEACANLAVTLLGAGRPEEADQAVDYAASLVPTPWGAYNLACYRALSGDATTAIDDLDRAFELGFTDALIKTDTDLDSLRETPAFQRIVERIDERVTERRQISDSVFPWQ